MIPFYYVLKVAFLIWMFHPSTQGAISVYNNFLLPYVKQYQGRIQEFEKKLEAGYKQATEAVGKKFGGEKDE